MAEDDAWVVVELGPDALADVEIETPNREAVDVEWSRDDVDADADEGVSVGTDVILKPERPLEAEVAMVDVTAVDINAGADDNEVNPDTVNDGVDAAEVEA